MGCEKDWDDDPLASPIEPVTSWPNHKTYQDAVNKIVENVDGELADMEARSEITHEEHEAMLYEWRQRYLPPEDTPPAA